MGFSLRYVGSLGLLIVLQACGAATPSSQIAIRLVRPSGSVSVSNTTSTASPAQVLSSEHCYFVHVTTASDALTKLSVPETCASSPKKVGLSSAETYNIGDMVKLMVPSGPQRRIDLVGVPKSRLQVTSCPKNLGFLANSQNPALSKFRIGGVDVALTDLTLYASTVKDLGVGLEVVDLPYTNLAVGTDYFCKNTDDPEEVQAGFVIEVSGGAESLDFGNFVVGTSVPSQTLTLRNTSSTQSVTNIYGDTMSASWRYKGGVSFPGQGGDCTSTLAPGASCILKVEFNPNYYNGLPVGVKNFDLRLNYTYNTEAQVAVLASQVNVIRGAAAQACLLADTESVSPTGLCPGTPLPAPSFSRKPYTIQLLDQGGNLPDTSATISLTIQSTDPNFVAQTETINAGSSSKSVFIEHGRETDVVQVLSISNGLDVNSIRPVSVTSVCNWAPTAGQFQSGQGTATEPYTICDMTQFTNIESSLPYFTKHYKLAKHIDLQTSALLPLGTSIISFTGLLDGNGYEIRNPNSVSASDNLGLFASLNNATLRNLVVVDPHFSGTTYVGALAGVASGNSIIENNTVVFSEATASLGTTNLSVNVGGLVGQINDSTVVRDNTINLGTTAASQRIIGVGPLGGLVGAALGNTLIERNNVVGAGKIYASHSTTETRIGGLLGVAFAITVTIRESKVGESVVLHSSGINRNSVGGLVGLLFGRIENSYFLGKMISSPSHSTDTIGGIAAETMSGAIIRNVVSQPAMVTATGGYKGAIVGSNQSSDVCSVSQQGCLFNNSLLTNPCPSPPGITCTAQSYSTASLTAANFNAPFGPDALTYGSNKWMFEASSGKIARQWERVAQLDPNFTDSSKSKVSLSGLEGSFIASTGKGALRSNVCKTSGQWYWEVTLLKGDWDEEFGIIAQTQSNPAGELSFGRPINGAWSLRDIAGSFAPYKGNYVDTTYGDPMYNSLYAIVPWNGNTTVQPNVGDVVGVYLDFASFPRKIRFFLNGVPLAQRGANTAEHTMIGDTLALGAYCAAVGKGNTTSSETVFDMNFGTRAFKYPSIMTDAGAKPYNFLE
jgi:hypothetical protein